MKYSGRPRLAALLSVFAVSSAMLPANADGSDPGALHFDLSPGEARTLFASGYTGTNMPVFKVCLASPQGYGAKVHLSESGKGASYGPVESIAPGTCLFASSGKLVISIDDVVTPGTLAEQQEAAERAMAWLADRTAALKAKEDRTEAETVLLEEFESRLENADENQLPVKVQDLKELQIQQTIEALESKQELTQKENLELALMRSKLVRLSNPTARVTVTLMPD